MLQSLDPIFDSVQLISNEAKEDQEFRAWWERADAFIRKALMEPGFILSPQFNSDSRAIFTDQAKEFFDVRYRPHRERLVDSVKVWGEGWTEDHLNKQMASQWSSLLKDLLMGPNGNIIWKGGVSISTILFHVGHGAD